MSATTLDKWVVCRQPKPDAAVRLFCAAWAGGNSSAFNKWPASLGDAVELQALQLPGRMSRSKEECLTSVAEIVDAAAKALVSCGLLDKPYALFGHSFGSLVMFELARKLAREAKRSPLCLIVAGCRPPDMLRGTSRETAVSQLSRDELVDHLSSLGGIPRELRDQKELLDYFLPPIRADYTALESYEYEHKSGEPPVSCRIVCLGGKADCSAPEGDLERWQSFTSGEFRLRMFDGEHFFLKGDGETAMLGFLRDVLLTGA